MRFWELAQWRVQNLSAITYDLALNIPLAKTDPLLGSSHPLSCKNKQQDLLLRFSSPEKRTRARSTSMAKP